MIIGSRPNNCLTRCNVMVILSFKCWLLRQPLPVLDSLPTPRRFSVRERTRFATIVTQGERMHG
jgi:hypothetical protein